LSTQLEQFVACPLQLKHGKEQSILFYFILFYFEDRKKKKIH